MKRKRVRLIVVQILLIASLVAMVASLAQADVINTPDQTPDIPAATTWSWSFSEGECFWQGFGLSFGTGLVGWILTAIKRVLGAGDSHE